MWSQTVVTPKGVQGVYVQIKRGKTKGLTRHTATWWWNQDVAKLVDEKRSRFKIWSKTRSETDRAAYCNARKIASKEIYKAQETERKNLELS